ncbi:MAG: MASE1 domain-containing protein, partial [Nocardioides sp.]|uniref:MASE1 domain-containing protein n=1 Tax=Nocardioides sp. TaxID=35761 RepID=UPI0023A06BD7
MSPPSHPRQVGVGFTAVLLASILLIDLALLAVREDMSMLTTYWSSVGATAGLLAVSPLRRWVVVVPLAFGLPLGACLAYAVPLGDAVLISGSHVAQAVLVAAVLTHLGRRRARVDSIPDLARLTAAAVLGGLLSVAVETQARVDQLPASTDLAVQVCSQHALSVLLLGVVVLATRDGWGERLRGAPVLLGIQTASLLAVLALVFAPVDSAPLTFAPIPILVWAAIAFDLRVVSWQLLGMAAAVTLATARGRGPFADEVVRPELVGSITMGYIAYAALITLPLAAIVSQRRVLMERVVSDEQLFRRTFTESPLGMVLMRGRAGALEITEVNTAAVQILGAPTAELEGRRFTDLVATLDHREHVFEGLLSRETDAWHGQASALGRPGSRVDLAIAAIA